ncbi:MAG: alpha/beta hydrolase [Myxococcaceae bacterium]
MRPLLPALLLLCSGCIVRSLARDAPLAEGCKERKAIAYVEAETPHEQKHHLNLYLPAGKGFPTVVFVHGGGWRLGDRDLPFDAYGKLGRRLARRGIAMAIISYRLAPAHKHPAHIQDVARALSWTLSHIGGYGGDPGRVFAMGHSAGAHLVTLAATDPRWLTEAGARPSQLAGVIALSGPYDVERLGRSTLFGGLPMVIPAFGPDPSVWREVSPYGHLTSATPLPFLVAAGDGDPAILREEADHLTEALKKAGFPATRRVSPFDDHFSIIMDLGEDGNALGGWVEQFVQDPQGFSKRAP